MTSFEETIVQEEEAIIESAFKKIDEKVDWNKLSDLATSLGYKYFDMNKLSFPKADDMRNTTKNLLRKLINENLDMISTGGLCITNEDGLYELSFTLDNFEID